MSGAGAARFPVSSDKAEALDARMVALGIHEEDLDESFVRSGGKGGQNVNKVATCVVLVHRPTGTSVKCQTARTQGMNRYLARKMLVDKLDTERRGLLSAREQEAEKIRRQKRRRSRRSKARMMADKAQQGAKKALRGAVRRED